jgi:hypothetical protein
MALMLVVASVKNDIEFIEKTLDTIDYHLRRNATAYESHSKKRRKMMPALE